MINVILFDCFKQTRGNINSKLITNEQKHGYDCINCQ